MNNRDWLSWPAGDIRDYGAGIAKSAKLSEKEAESLVWHMLVEAGIDPKTGEPHRLHHISDKDFKAFTRRLERDWRKTGKLWAKEPARAALREARSEVARIRRELGFLKYQSDGGWQDYAYPRPMKEQSEALNRVDLVALRLRRALDFGNVEDQLRLAFELGAAISTARYIAFQKPKLDAQAKARSKGGGHNIKGPSMEKRREVYFYYLEQEFPPQAAARCAADDLGFGVENVDAIKRAFPNRRLPKLPAPPTA